MTTQHPLEQRVAELKSATTEMFEEEGGNHAIVAKTSIDEQPYIADLLGIRGISTLMLFDRGE